MAAPSVQHQTLQASSIHHLLKESRTQLLDKLLKTTEKQICFNPYFTFLTEQCETALHSGGRHTSIQKFHDILQLAELLQDAQKSRGDVVDRLLQSSSQELSSQANNESEATRNRIGNAVDLVARLITMMHVGSLTNSIGPEQLLLRWRDGSLRGFVASHFAAPKLMDEHVRLEKTFNLQSIERVAGISIRWTSNMADHLYLAENDTVLLFFHHATFLKHNKNGILSDALAEETLRTMSLLLPRMNKDVRHWFKKQEHSASLDENAVKCPHLKSDSRHINNFHFWRDRIVVLKQIFDEAEPRTLCQWWYDRRKGPQWYTFWVAVLVLLLTIFFGVVQSIEGALQVYKAYNAD